MNASQAALSWTGRHWFFSVALFSAAQLALVFWLAENRLSRTRAPISHVGVRIIPPTPTAGLPGQMPEGFVDPTLFALVTPRSFSRSAWLTLRPFDYRIVNEPGSSLPLSLATEELADDFAEFVRTNVVEGDRLADGLPLVLTQPVRSSQAVVPSTALKVEGAWSGRVWTSDQPLPLQSEPILTKTVVRVLVSAEGMPLSAALLSSSGTAKADQDALGFAKGLRFSRATATPAQERPFLSSGASSCDLVFQWYKVTSTEPPPPVASIQSK